MRHIFACFVKDWSPAIRFVEYLNNRAQNLQAHSRTSIALFCRRLVADAHRMELCFAVAGMATDDARAQRVAKFNKKKVLESLRGRRIKQNREGDVAEVTTSN